MTPDGLIEYRVMQLEKRQEQHEQAVSQIRDAIISVREDSREIRARIGDMETADKRLQRAGEFRWTKWQVWLAGLVGVFTVGVNFYLAVKKG